MNLDQRLRDAFPERADTPISADFEDQIMARLPQRKPRRRYSPAAILGAYWMLAAIIALVVISRIGWVEIDTTAMAVVGGALVLIAAPIS